MRTRTLTLPLVLAALLLGALQVSCVSHGTGRLAPGRMQEVARSHGYQWTGVAVSSNNRVFVNYPRWHSPHRFSVAEALADGSVRPFPDERWNDWTPESSASPEDRLVCVQSVHVDARNRLWILDAGSPGLKGVIPGGAKLIEVKLATNRVVRVIRFDASIAPERSYLNDVRVDTARNVAYITDSGLGAIVVVDLATNRVRRVLAGHPSTQAETTDITIGGKPLRFADGSAPMIHSDGLALDPKGEYLYYQALTGRTLYRVPAALLWNGAAEATIAGAVENLGQTVVTDGMEMDAAGNLYFSALEQGAVVVRRPDGALHTLIADERLRWPDSFAIRAGSLYVATSQIHLTPWFSGESGMPVSPYLVLRTGLYQRQ